MTKQEALLEYTLRLADSSIVLGHRLSQWCGHGPILEEDIAITNIALDFVGLGTNLLNYAAELEGKDRTADDLAFLRNERDYKNLLITEQPNGDYAYTIARQFFYDVFTYYLFAELKNSKDAQISAISEKAIKEVTYHLRHSGEWMLRLGDGTEESHSRMQKAVNELWVFVGEFFDADEVDTIMCNEGIAPDLASIKTKWEKHVKEVLSEATIECPTGTYFQKGSRTGQHSEHLGFMLAEMQNLQRSYPEAKW